jgi:uncharacterized protein (TIGR03000 family)
MHMGGGASFSRGGSRVVSAAAIRPFGIRPGFFVGFYGGFPRIYGGYYGGYGWGGYYDNSYYFGPSSDAHVAQQEPLGNYQAFYPPEQPLPATNPNSASLTVRVPDDAEIWFDDTKMTLTGPVREYVTPPLTPGQDYSYMIRARWSADSRVFDQAHKVGFRPGQTVLVDFLTPPPATSKQPPVMQKVP